MKATARGEDVLLLDGAITLNPHDARQLAGSLFQAAAEAMANGERGPVVQAEAEAATPARRRPVLALLQAGHVLFDHEIHNTAPLRIERGIPGGAFVFELQDQMSFPGSPIAVDIAVYQLKERA